MAARADLQDMPFPEADLTIVCWFKQINLEHIATTSTLFRTISGTDFPDCAHTHIQKTRFHWETKKQTRPQIRLHYNNHLTRTQLKN